MKKCLLFFVVLFGIASRAQNQCSKASTLNLLENLNNSAVLFERNYIESIELDSMAKKVCYTIEDSSLGRLIEYLSFPDRVVVSHILLTNLLEPTKKKLKYEYNYNGNVFESTTYTMNNFSWTRTKDIIETDVEDMRKIKEYWMEKDFNSIKIQGRCGGIQKIKIIPRKQ